MTEKQIKKMTNYIIEHCEFLRPGMTYEEIRLEVLHREDQRRLVIYAMDDWLNGPQRMTLPPLPRPAWAEIREELASIWSRLSRWLVGAG